MGVTVDYWMAGSAKNIEPAKSGRMQCAPTKFEDDLGRAKQMANQRVSNSNAIGLLRPNQFQ